MVVVVGSVKKNLSVGDAVFRGDRGVIDLRNADVEQSIAGADYQGVGPTDGIGQSGSRAEVVRIEGDFAGRRE
jgi:hypothetical protein